MFRLGDESAASNLADEITSENLLTGMYAIRALEMTGAIARDHGDVIRAAQDSPYEFTRRIARRLSQTLELE